MALEKYYSMYTYIHVYKKKRQLHILTNMKIINRNYVGGRRLTIRFRDKMYKKSISFSLMLFEKENHTVLLTNK